MKIFGVSMCAGLMAMLSGCATLTGLTANSSAALQNELQAQVVKMSPAQQVAVELACAQTAHDLAVKVENFSTLTPAAQAAVEKEAADVRAACNPKSALEVVTNADAKLSGG